MASHPKGKPIFVAVIIAICFAAGFGIGYAGSELIKKKAPRNGEYKITICNTGDVHGAYFDRDYKGEPISNSMADVAAFIDSLRSQGADPIVIDCGDNLQGDNAAYYFNYVDTTVKHLFTRMQEYIGYDAVVIGNHDIEATHPVYDRLKRESKTPILAANARCCEGPHKGECYFDEYTLVRRDGIRIAIIGMTNANIKNWLAEPMWKGIEFLRISDCVQEITDRVNAKEKPHLTILAIHSGLGPEDGSVIESEGLFLAKTVKGIDMVICAHDHMLCGTVVDGPDGPVAVMDAGTKACNVGKAEFTLTFSQGALVGKKASSISVSDMNSVNPSKDFTGKFSDDLRKVSEFANRKICTLAADIDFSLAASGPCPYLKLIHSAQLAASGADISFAAPVSDKGSVKAGEITFNDLSRIYRFENTLYKIELTGAQIRNYLEYSYEGWLNYLNYSNEGRLNYLNYSNEGRLNYLNYSNEGRHSDRARTYNFDSAEGINYTVDRSAPKGSRIQIKGLSDGRAFDPEAIYTVAMTSYRAAGGGYHLRDGAGIDPSSIKVLETYPDIRTIIGNLMSSSPAYLPQSQTNWRFIN